MSTFEFILIGLPTLALWGVCCVFITLVIMLVVGPVALIILHITKVDSNKIDGILEGITMVAYAIAFICGPAIIYTI